MANLKLTNLASYKNYFYDLAQRHISIDGFKWGDKKVIRNDNRSAMPPRVLVVTPYNAAKYQDQRSDNTVKRKVARVAYMIVSDSEKFADEESAFDFCEAVIEQILARILVDKRGSLITIGDPPEEVWSMIATDINAWTTGPVQMTLGSTKYIGWEMEVPFLDNTDLKYDANKWADPKTFDSAYE